MNAFSLRSGALTDPQTMRRLAVILGQESRQVHRCNNASIHTVLNARVVVGVLPGPTRKNALGDGKVSHCRAKRPPAGSWPTTDDVRDDGREALGVHKPRVHTAAAQQCFPVVLGARELLNDDGTVRTFRRRTGNVDELIKLQFDRVAHGGRLARKEGNRQ